MKKNIVLLYCILYCFFSSLFGQSSTLLLQDVFYLDFSSNQMKKGDILIVNGLIQRIRKNIRVPKKAKVINGNNKWLIPGLIDSHIHLFQSGGLYTRPDIADLRQYRPYELERQWLKEQATDLLKRYLKCGITTVIDMGGPLSNFEIRDELKNQKNVPNLFLTGPLISTIQPEEFGKKDPPIIKATSKEEARELVREQLPFQADFIKIWYITLPNQSATSNYDIVKAAIDESHKNGIKAAVHATELNTAKLALKAGADILVHSIDEPVDEDFIQLIKKNKAVYIPTLIVHGNYVEIFSQTPQLSMEDFQLSHPIPLGTLFDSRHLKENKVLQEYQAFAPYLKKELEEQSAQRFNNIVKLLTKGVTIATGTDAGNIGTLHASSFYEEIAAMQTAGLGHLDILKASTINGAKVLGKEKELGSIEEGKKADLVLLDQNPLDTLDALKNIHLVIKSGQALSPDTILVESPENLVQQQLNAYNARNLEAFLAPYSEEVEIYNFPNELTAKGKEAMRKTYGFMFKNLPHLHCELVNRISMGNTVIDYEKVTGILEEGTVEAIAIYKIEGGKIAKVYFVY